jgi:MerR family mercuric resistance operon transcriptional regulator
MKSMTVGQVARQAGVGVETVRFYERTGLLEKPARRASGYRAYDEETVNRLRFIQRAKELGFTLGEIRELLSLRSCADQPCDDVRSRAEAKIAEIDEKVALLLRMREVLGRLTSSCGERQDANRCPILEVLEGRDSEGTRRTANEDDNRPLSAQPDPGQAGRHDDAARARPRRVSRPDRGS